MCDSLSHAFTQPPDPPFRVLAWPLCFMEQVDSTNRRVLQDFRDGVVCVAESQSAGRGQMGRAWHSAPGLGLWLSVGLNGPARGLGFAAALAVRDALSSYAPVDVKWPNDLYHAGRKLCGILIERRDKRSALGIGLNIRHSREDFPPALRDTATSLALAAGAVPARAGILSSLLVRLDSRLASLRAGEYARIRTEWADACTMVGKYVCRDHVEGTVTAIDEDGALLVATASGVRRIVSGNFMCESGS